MFECNKKEIDLFNKKIWLTERKVVDVIELSNFISNLDEKEMANPQTALLANAIMLSHALKYNYENKLIIKIIRLFKKDYTPKKYTSLYLYNNISSTMLNELVFNILELEGNKKKV